MAKIEVKCPKCGKIEVIKYGKSPEGKQRYKCKNTNCKCTTFLLEYSYNGSQPNISLYNLSKATSNAPIPLNKLVNFIFSKCSGYILYNSLYIQNETSTTMLFPALLYKSLYPLYF